MKRILKKIKMLFLVLGIIQEEKDDTRNLPITVRKKDK